MSMNENKSLNSCPQNMSNNGTSIPTEVSIKLNDGISDIITFNTTSTSAYDQKSLCKCIQFYMESAGGISRLKKRLAFYVWKVLA